MSTKPIPFNPKKKIKRQTEPQKTPKGQLVPMKGVQLGAVFETMAIARQIKNTPIEKRGGAWKNVKKKPV